MHERAVLGRRERLTVDLLATHPGDLLHALRADPTLLAAEVRADLVRLIRRDHVFHNNRRRPR